MGNRGVEISFQLWNERLLRLPVTFVHEAEDVHPTYALGETSTQIRLSNTTPFPSILLIGEDSALPSVGKLHSITTVYTSAVTISELLNSVFSKRL